MCLVGGLVVLQFGAFGSSAVSGVSGASGILGVVHIRGSQSSHWQLVERTVTPNW